jgi:hypothetical protein
MKESIIVVALALLSAEANAQAESGVRTCTEANRTCNMWCRAHGANPSCFADCKERQATCLQTGTYSSPRGPDLTGLIKK